MTAINVVPLLTVHTDDDLPDDPDAPVRDEFAAGLAVAYTPGPPYGEQIITWQDLDKLGLTRRSLRRQAANHLDAMLDTVRLHGAPPAVMVSFHGIESSLLASDELWAALAASGTFGDLSVDLPGDLVVGVPARDVLVVTGSESEAGLAKARRCIDRMFFAGGEHLLTRDLLVWRDPGWEPLGPSGPSLGPSLGPPGPAHDPGLGPPAPAHGPHESVFGPPAPANGPGLGPPANGPGLGPPAPAHGPHESVFGPPGFDDAAGPEPPPGLEPADWPVAGQSPTPQHFAGPPHYT